VKKRAHFQITKDKAGEWRWRLRASNGRIVASGEGYKREAGCIRGIWALLKAAAAADIPAPK
jgi:uncharacterized protein YegP (UPF0339 family)